MIRRITMTTILLFAVVGFATAAVAGQTATATEAVNETTATETVSETAEPAGPDENASDSAVGPGERLSGVIGVQEAEIEGEVADRTFGIQIAQAASENAKAKVVGEQLADIEARIESLEAERDRLEQARENGTVDAGEYQARAATLAAKQKAAERLANRTNDTAGKLPQDVLAENGVNVTAIRTLKHRADELTGPEVAEIARSIAGPPAGVPGQGRPAHSGGAPHETDDDHERDEQRGANETDDHGPPEGHNETDSREDEDRDDSDEYNETDSREDEDRDDSDEYNETDSREDEDVDGADEGDETGEREEESDDDQPDDGTSTDSEPDDQNHDDHSATEAAEGNHEDGR